MGKIFSFYGSDHRVGTSMLSQCTAERLSAIFPDKEILLVHAQGRDMNAFSSGISENMDNIRPYLTDRIMDPRDVLEKARWKDNLFVIGGVGSPAGNSEFHPDMACYFFDAMSNVCDVVISDSGCEIDQGMALGSLLSSNKVYMVLTQRESAVRRYEWLKGIYDRLEVDMDRFVINEYSKKSIFTDDYIRERLEFKKENLFTVRRSQYGTESEIEMQSLLHYRDGGLLKDIDTLVQDIRNEL